MRKITTSRNVLLFILFILASVGWARAQQCDPLAVGPTVDYRLTYDPGTQRFTAWIVPTSTEGHRLVNAQFTIIAPNGYTPAQNSGGRDGNFNITSIRGTWTDFVFDNELFATASPGALASLNGLSVHQVGMAKTAVDIPNADVTPGVPIALFSFPATGCAGQLRILVNDEPLRNEIRNTYGSNVNNSISIQIPYETGTALAQPRYCKNATESAVNIVLPDLQNVAVTQCATPGSTYTQNFLTQVRAGATVPPGSFTATAAQFGSYTVTTSAGVPASVVSITQATGDYTLTYPTQPGSLTITNTLRDNCNLASETASVVISWTSLGQVTVTPANPTSCSGTNGSLALSGLTAGQSYTVSYTQNNGTPVTQTLTANGSGIITVSNLSAGDYTNITVSQNNCTSTPQAATLSNPAAPQPPTITASPSQTVCVGSPLTLSASGTNLQWTGPGGFASTANSFSVATSVSGTQIYSVTQNVSGCTSVPASVTVVVNPLPSVALVAQSTTVCQGAPLSLTANVTGGTAPFSFRFTGPNLTATTNTTGVLTIASATVANSGSYTVVVTDAVGCSAVVGTTTAIAVSNCNIPPFVPGKTIVTPPNTPATVCMAITDPNTTDVHSVSLCSAPAHGTANVSVNNSVMPHQVCITYTPTTGYIGNDQICFITCDGAGGCDTTYVPVIIVPPVTPTNDPKPPVLTTTTITTPINTSATACMPYSDPNISDTHSVSVCAAPLHGTATASIDPVTKLVCVAYTPTNGYSGPDQVCIRICDNTGLCDQVNVPIMVIPPIGPPTDPQPPVVVPPVIVLPPGSFTTICVQINDPNPGDTHTATICGQPASGTISNVTVDNQMHMLCLTYTAGPTGGPLHLEGCIRVCDQTNLCINVPVPITILACAISATVTPTSTTVCAGTSINLTAAVSGNSGTVTYAWRGPSGFTGTGATVSIANATTANAGSYTVVVTDVTGCTAVATTSTAITVASCVSLSGQVFNDPNGLTDNQINGTGIGAVSGQPLYASLIGPGGTVVGSVPVSSTGNYTFTPANGVQPNTSYTIVVGTTPGVVGQPAPSPTIPTADWVYTGEGTSPTGDGLPNGITTVTTTTTAVTGVNFGLDQRPVTNSVTTPSMVNPIGAVSLPVSATSFSGTDPDGTIASIRITTFPTNVTSLTINGVVYTPANFPPNGVTIPANSQGQPTQPILIDPVDGAPNAVITYTVIDNAGVEDLTPGTVTIPFTQPCLVTVSAVSSQTAVCPGGAISLLASTTGATGNVTYSWTGPNNFVSAQQSPTISSVAPAAFGTYTVRITDANSCTATATVTITSRTDCERCVANLKIGIKTLNAQCGQATGRAEATLLPTPATAVNYTWTNLATNATVANSATATSLMSGMYVVVASYLDGTQTCVARDTVVISDAQSPMLMQSSVTGAACGQTNGSATLTVTGGTAPYTLSWSGPQSGTQSVSASPVILNGLAAGNYVFSLTESGSTCKRLLEVYVPSLAPASFGVVASTTAVSACGTSNGQLAITWNAVGTGPYVVTVNGSSTTVTGTSLTLTGLAPGGYSIQVASNNGACQSQPTTATIQTTGATAVTGWTNTPVTCANQTSTISFAGGQSANVTYVLSRIDGMVMGTTNGATPRSFTVSPSTYVVSRYENGCVTTQTFSITSPEPIDIAVQALPSACGRPGSVTVTSISGGTPAYTVQVRDAANAVVANPANLPAGQYTVIVTDASGCSVSLGTAVTAGGVAPTVFANATASRICTGQPIYLNASVNNGTTPYTFRWTGPANYTSTVQNPVISNAQASNGGSYTVVVTDANGCSATAVTSAPIAVTICQPPCFVRDVSLAVVNSDCGQANGRVSATVQPAAPAGATVTYQWRNLATNSIVSVAQSLTGLSAGAYAVTVTVTENGQSCAYSDTASVNDVGSPIGTIAATTAAACGQTNGSVTLNLIGGNPPYAISWTGTQSGSANAFAATQTINGLAAGNYIFTVTSSGSTCKAVIPAQVAIQPGSLNLVGTLVQPQACGTNNGRVTLTWSPLGAGPYQVTFNGVTTTVASTSVAFTNLAPGAYTAQITTVTPSCYSDSKVFVLSPTTATPIVGWTANAPNCANQAGTIAYAGGQAATTQYTLSTLNGAQVGTTAGNTPASYTLTTGTYVVTRIESGTCVTADTLRVIAPAAIDFNVQVVGGQCGQPASLTVANVSGGVGPYTVQVTNASSQTVSTSNLPAGTYTVSVMDRAGCMVSTTLVVGSSSSVTAVAGVSGTPSICVGNSFALSGNVNGGTGPFTYSWTGPNGFASTQQNPTVTNAQATASGTYTLVVTSATGCTATSTVSLTVSLANCPCPTRDISLVTVGTQCGQANGRATATLVPNPGPGVTVTYSWSAVNGAVIGNTPTISGLAAGAYMVTITTTEPNGKQCTYSQMASISPSNAPQVTVVGINGSACNDANGSVTLDVQGVSGPYSVFWSGAATGNTTGGTSPVVASGLVSGNYTFTVTQGSSATCSAIAVATVPLNTATLSLTAAVAQSPTNCGLADGSITVTWNSVGNGPYQLTVNGVTTTVNTTSQTLTNLKPDTYVIQVMSGDPVCAMEAITVVLNPVGAAAITGWTSTSALCAGSTGTVTFTGGQPAGTQYLLSDASGSVIASVGGATAQSYSLAPGIYQVTRTLGTCVTTLPLTIQAASAIGFNIALYQPTCALPSSGSLAVNNITGGTGIYTTQVTSASGVVTNLTNLSSGSYTVTVTDGNGCSVSNVVSLTVGNCAFCFNAKVYLQGALLDNASALSTTGEPLMRDDLRSLGYLPASTPYGNGVYSSFAQVNNPISETMVPSLTAVTGEQAVVDWVLVELRNKTNPAQVMYTRSGLVLRNGTIIAPNGQCLDFNQVAADNYYVSVRHRNHLGVMTQETIAIGPGNDLTVDFRTRTPQQIWDKGTAVNALYADKERYVVPYATSYYALWGGNANRNTVVAYQGPNEDLTELYNQVVSSPNSFNSPSHVLDGYYSGDVNLNGQTVYQGQFDEPTIIFNILTLHPSNGFNSPSFENEQQLP